MPSSQNTPSRAPGVHEPLLAEGAGWWQEPLHRAMYLHGKFRKTWGKRNRKTRMSPNAILLAAGAPGGRGPGEGGPGAASPRPPAPLPAAAAQRPRRARKRQHRRGAPASPADMSGLGAAAGPGWQRDSGGEGAGQPGRRQHRQVAGGWRDGTGAERRCPRLAAGSWLPWCGDPQPTAPASPSQGSLSSPRSRTPPHLWISCRSCPAASRRGGAAGAPRSAGRPCWGPQAGAGPPPGRCCRRLATRLIALPGSTR